MPFSAQAVWSLTSTRSSVTHATPSTVCSPDSVRFAVDAALQGALNAVPPVRPSLESVVDDAITLPCTQGLGAGRSEQPRREEYQYRHPLRPARRFVYQVHFCSPSAFSTSSAALFPAFAIWIICV